MEGIRKSGDGKFGFVFARACANLLRKSPNEGRCMPTFSDVVAAMDATSGKALRELLGGFKLSTADGKPMEPPPTKAPTPTRRLASWGTRRDT